MRLINNNYISRVKIIAHTEVQTYGTFLNDGYKCGNRLIVKNILIVNIN